MTECFELLNISGGFICQNFWINFGSSLRCKMSNMMFPCQFQKRWSSTLRDGLLRWPSSSWLIFMCQLRALIYDFPVNNAQKIALHITVITTAAQDTEKTNQRSHSHRP
ncbi:hypothetical protein AVEN_59261-1 [Araneus ventricosus]|uniref:Uncharacterized protein n=1 Tax=Araneus ventricosus TaxID=182803 RepID=A0A4Y2UGD1_ARAVE|nr:hypothetical protein AVEN_59261-1 [Araneus ventricosus]